MKEVLKRERKNKGITLIALVITIIVLLILAAVSIATLTGKNGILTKANTAKTKTTEAQVEEEIKLAYNTVQTDGIINGWDIQKKAEEMQKELQKQDPSATVTVDGTNLKISYKGYEITIKEDGTIGEIAKSKITINQFSISGTKVTTPPVPDGFTHTGEGTIDTGYVIKDGEGNEFVWVPVDKDQKISVSVTSEESITSLVITDPYGDDLSIPAVSGKEYNAQITPTINGPYRLAITTESGEIKKSILKVHSLYAVDTFGDFMCTEEYAQAQGYSNLQEMIEDWGYETEEECLMDGSWLKEYEETEDYADKVNTNGGFYIGRYEAGDSSVTADRTSTTEGTLVTQKDKYVYNWITQTNALSKAKAYNANVTSSLLTGEAWDRTLGWLYETGEKSATEIAGDSTSWGNYYNDSFSNTDKLIKTGEFEQTKANNIYDLAGNVNEWTTEAYYTDNRVSRGGFYFSGGSSYPASDRINYGTSNSYNGIGFRLALYL